MFHYGTPCEHL